MERSVSSLCQDANSRTLSRTIRVKSIVGWSNNFAPGSGLSSAVSSFTRGFEISLTALFERSFAALFPRLAIGSMSSSNERA